jgi:HEAT repeat protein/putative zinc finger protein
MNCDWIKENVVLYVYDELSDDAKYEFEHHVHGCLGCRQEVEAALAFKKDMAALPVQEVSPNLLAASRMKLQEELEHAEQARGGWGMFVFDVAGWLHQIKLAPALTMALLMIGFGGGAITAWRISNGPQVTDQGARNSGQPVSTASIAGIDSVTIQPNSNQVQVKYDVLQPQIYVGAADDPRMQSLLLAAQTSNNIDVRLTATGILKGRTQDDDVREALISSLRYDKNPGVRLSALDALKSYVRNDVHVRDAVVEALLHDSNPGVRQEAISLLDPVKADSSVHEALRVLLRDQNAYIRGQAQRYIASTPNLD